MTVLIVFAASWLVMTLAITGLFLGARRSHVLYCLLFGAKPSAEVHTFATASNQASSGQDSRLVA